MRAEATAEGHRAPAWQAFAGTESGPGRALRRWAWILPVVWSGVRFLLRNGRIARAANAPAEVWLPVHGSFARARHRPDRREPARLRLTCWNVAYGRRYARIARVLREQARADVYMLQELDRGCRRSGWRDVARCLARELGLEYAFAAEFCETAEGRGSRPGLHGQAILSRLPLERVRVLRFAHQAHDWSKDLVQPRCGGRMALVAEVVVGGRRLVLYNTHLESRGDPAGRARQLDEIVADIDQRGIDGAVVIAGDLNTRRGAAAGEPAGYLGDHPLFGAAARAAVARLGRRRVGASWFLVRGAEAQPVPLRPLRPAASDHEPLVLELRLDSRR